MRCGGGYRQAPDTRRAGGDQRGAGRPQRGAGGDHVVDDEDVAGDPPPRHKGWAREALGS
jgi:hypothetical protein